MLCVWFSLVLCSLLFCILLCLLLFAFAVVHCFCLLISGLLHLDIAPACMRLSFTPTACCLLILHLPVTALWLCPCCTVTLHLPSTGEWWALAPTMILITLSDCFSPRVFQSARIWDSSDTLWWRQWGTRGKEEAIDVIPSSFSSQLWPRHPCFAGLLMNREILVVFPLYTASPLTSLSLL